MSMVIEINCFLAQIVKAQLKNFIIIIFYFNNLNIIDSNPNYLTELYSYRYL